MKQILTENDLNKVAGKFIIELNADKPIQLTDFKVDLEFYIAKRINFICYGGDGIISSDIYGNTFTYTKEKFIEQFNASGLDKTRYHRLLYAEEIKVLFTYMIQRNY